jgi:hypothetical protein
MGSIGGKQQRAKISCYCPFNSGQSNIELEQICEFKPNLKKYKSVAQVGSIDTKSRE